MNGSQIFSLRRIRVLGLNLIVLFAVNHVVNRTAVNRLFGAFPPKFLSRICTVRVIPGIIIGIQVVAYDGLLRQFK
jgi:hypothetical protein